MVSICSNVRGDERGGRRKSRWFAWLLAAGTLTAGCTSDGPVGDDDKAVGEADKVNAAEAEADVSTRRAAALARGARTVWVVMKHKPDLSTAKQTTGWKSKGRAAYRALTEQARTSQANLVQWLSARDVVHKTFWAINTVQVTADAATIAQIESRSDVEKVVADFEVQIPPPAPGQGKATIDAVEWNITEVGAPTAWADFGTTGEGIVVGTIDTGAEFEHPALVETYRGRQADGTFVHDYNWHDPSNVCGFPSDVPCDNDGHGTHTMGTIAGNDGGENQIGVAPGVRWITAKGCEDFSCSFEALLSAGQWMLAPTDLSGNNPDPTQRPHIVSNSWGGFGGDDFYMEIVDSWVAAGIFPVFSNGNSGPYCMSSGSPGDYPASYSSGAYDANGVIAWFSSLGESAYGGIKPNLAAPGVDVRSSVPGGGYDWFSGTSMAAPHVAGAVALLWSAAPAIQGDIQATRELLDASAIDTDDTSCGGDPGNNNVWGEGKLNIPAALEIAPIGPTGYLAGNVSADGGTALSGAKVSVTGTANRTRATDAEGAYSLRLPVGDYDATVSAFGYLSESVSGVSIAEDATTTLDFSLDLAPSFELSGVVRDAVGGPLEGATVRILDTPLDSALTSVDGAYLFASVPQGMYTVSVDAGGCYVSQLLAIDLSADLTLDVSLERTTDAYGYQCHPVAFDYIAADTSLGLVADDGSIDVALPFPFTLYGVTHDSVSVDSNGYIAFENPFSALGNESIPSQSEPNAAVYGFWDDLIVGDESQLLTTVVGDAPFRKVVFEWRDVTFFGDDTGESVSFEIVLSEGGEITIQYANTNGTLPSGISATTGIEDGAGVVALEYSHNQPILRSGLAIMYEVPFSGFVQGVVSDRNDSGPVAGATVTATLVSDGSTRTVTSDANGFYRLQATEGGYSVEVSKENYVSSSEDVSIRHRETTVADFVLSTPRGEVSPNALQLIAPLDAVRTRTLTLSNTGSAPMQYSVEEAGGRKQAVSVTATRPRSASKDPLAYTSEGLFEDDMPAVSDVAPLDAGDILASFTPTGLGLGWGIGQADNLWLSDVYAVQNVEFEIDGTPTGNGYFASWAGYWPADMAFDEAPGTVCQLAVGSDNAIYCWDPATGDVVTQIHDPAWAGISQRGLAHKSSDDTFFVGGWNEGIIYHIQGASGASPGAVISSCMPADGAISGLAYNQDMDVLWAATNSFDDTIYELDPYDCTVISALAPPQSGGFQGAGLELDSEGNLWAVAQNPNQVFLVDSGVPMFSDVGWLSVEPAAGDVAEGEELELTVTVDTTGLEPGLYLASLFVVTNSGREPLLRIPVSLVVSGYMQGVNAGGTEYVDGEGEVWAADQRYSRGGWGYLRTGKVITTRSNIRGTSDPALYRDQRAKAYAYRFDDVPNGVYELDLRFAEIENNGVGNRIFDVVAENELVLPAHDIMYETNRLRTANDYRFFVEVSDGELDLRLVPRAESGDPVIAALRVIHRPDR